MRYGDIKVIYTVDGVWHDWSSAQDVLIRKNALFDKVFRKLFYLDDYAQLDGTISETKFLYDYPVVWEILFICQSSLYILIMFWDKTEP